MALLCAADAPAARARPVDGDLRPAVLSERFDTTLPPALPGGWSASTARTSSGDFITTGTGAFSPPGCVLGTNASVAQALTTPPLDLTGWRGCVLSWKERRSASHDASLSIEISTDGGNEFIPVTGDPLPLPGGTDWTGREVPLPAWTDGSDSVLVRWRVAGDGTGATGTIRFDDVVVVGTPRRDVSIAADSISPPRPVAGDRLLCAARVVNTGFEPCAGVTVTWSVDADGDGRPDGPGSGSSMMIGSLKPGEQAPAAYDLTLPPGAPLLLFAIASADSDLVTANDTARFRILAAAAARSVVVNEIMFDPLPGMAEYVEIFNSSADSISLDGWRLTDDGDDSTLGGFGPGAIVLGPGGYLVCSPDSGVRSDYMNIPAEVPVVEGVKGLSLNNTGDMLLLVDGTDWAVDSIVYDPGWHTPALDLTQGRSLERIESGSGEAESWNWGTSADASGGTPGYRNSIAAEASPREEILSFSPNPFSPNGDGFEDVTIIGYRLGGVSALARVRIYDREGRLVRTLTGSSYVAGDGTFVWNGYDDRGRKVPIGIYVVLLDAVDGSGMEAFTARGAVVVAGRL